MKKKTLQKVLATSLVGAMAVGTLAACGGSSNTTETPASSAAESTVAESSTAAESSEEAPAEAVAGIDGWTAFEETVTLQIPVYDRGGAVDVSNNYWTNWIQENFGDTYNIDVEFVAIPRGDVLNAYAQLASAQDLPTILMEYDFPKQAQWADDGYLAELDIEKFKQIAPNYWQQMLDEGSDAYTALGDTDYFVLARRPYWDSTYNYVTFYRADWLDALGLEYPTTYAESLEVYAALKEAGYAEYPAGGSRITGAGVDQNYTFRDYPQDEYTWATTGDYAIPALSTEATKKLIKRQNELYNLGYLNPEFVTREATDNEADFIAGKAFTYTAYIAPSIAVLDSFYETNPDAHLSIYVTEDLIVDDEGVTNVYRPNNPFGMMISFSSLASDDEITAGMMYLEWLLQPENLFTFQYGIEGETFEYVDGYPTITNNTEGEYAMANNNKDYFCAVIESKVLGSIEDDVKLNAPTGYPDSDEWYEQIVANYYGMQKIAESGRIQPDCMFATTISAVTDNQAALLSLYEEYRTKLTVCAPEEYDALYDQYSQEYLNAGYQAIIDERGEALEAGLTSRLTY